jgi:hypothetical protein
VKPATNEKNTTIQVIMIAISPEQNVICGCFGSAVQSLDIYSDT